MDEAIFLYGFAALMMVNLLASVLYYTGISRFRSHMRRRSPTNTK